LKDCHDHLPTFDFARSGPGDRPIRSAVSPRISFEASRLDETACQVDPAFARAPFRSFDRIFDRQRGGPTRVRLRLLGERMSAERWEKENGSASGDQSWRETARHFAGLQMREVLGRSEPIVDSVDERDRDARELLLRDARQTADIDAVHFSDRSFRSDTEGADATAPTEVVQVLAGVEPVLGELGLSRQQAKVIRRRHGGPESGSAPDRAVAAIRTLGEIEFGLELDRAAMASAAVSSEHGEKRDVGWWGGCSTREERVTTAPARFLEAVGVDRMRT
jgi:hypothetical protein